jgi:hypothetical protein
VIAEPIKAQRPAVTGENKPASVIGGFPVHIAHRPQDHRAPQPHHCVIDHAKIPYTTTAIRTAYTISRPIAASMNRL